jgi:O-antigen ligase
LRRFRSITGRERFSLLGLELSAGNAVSAVAESSLDLAAPPARRPGTPARFLLFLLAAAGSAAVLAIGFPRGAPDRLPVLLLSLALCVDAVWRPSVAIRDFCFAFPVAGLFASIFGTTDPIAWPVLLFGGLAVGWTFRFLYDFESVPDPSRLDGSLRALVGVWTLGTILALIRARTLWAVVHGLRGRAVNGEGLQDAAAIRESVLALAILGAGAGFFFLMRRSGERARSEATRAALVGTAISAGVALLQAIGLFPPESRPFWKLTGRLSGGATDPNALGLLCGLSIVVVLALAIGPERPRWAMAALIPLPIGLALSGSRSGFLVAVLGSAAVIAVASLERRWRATLAVGALAFALAVAFLPHRSPGGVGGRLGQLFRSALTLEDRASSRPILWRAALRLFAESPVVGSGVGSFSWRLPDLAGEAGISLPMRDNPGSAYLQALAETGIVGLFLTLVFGLALARVSLARIRELDAPGGAVAVLAFLLALVVGSHWLAPEVSFLFFLLGAGVAIPQGKQTRPIARLSAALLAVSTIFAAVAIAATSDPRGTFRHDNRIGFYGREVGPGGAFRWTRRRFAVWVGRGATERLSLANYSPEGKPVEVAVRADGPVIFRRTIAPGAALSLALWSGGHPRAFRFELSRSFVPKRLGLSDRRSLGVVAVFPEERSGTPL